MIGIITILELFCACHFLVILVARFLDAPTAAAEKLAPVGGNRRIGLIGRLFRAFPESS